MEKLSKVQKSLNSLIWAIIYPLSENDVHQGTVMYQKPFHFWILDIPSTIKCRLFIYVYVHMVSKFFILVILYITSPEFWNKGDSDKRRGITFV